MTRRTAMIGWLLLTVCNASEASAARDRTPPTKPGSFRVTASYTFIIYARDAAGNGSASVSVTATLPRDTAPPAIAPVVSVTNAGSTYVSLAWTPAHDDGPYLFYTILLDGVAYTSAGSNLAVNVNLLEPETRYTFAVQAYDYGGNLSPLSAPVVATTLPRNANDTTPPTMPGNLSDHGMAFPDGETWLFWQQSTDNFDPQAVIRYDVYVNGVLDHQLIGAGATILYGDPGVPNTYQVIAVDSAGNRSTPATLTTP